MKKKTNSRNKNQTNKTRNKRWLTTNEVATFSILAAILFLSTFALLWIPNVHLIGLFIGSMTLVYRKKALIPLYIFVLLQGIYLGFSLFWIPNLYIWLPLWFVFYRFSYLHLSKKVQAPLYMIVCGLHGLLFGILYAPAQMLFFGLSLQGIIAWVIAGFPFDVIHAIGNFVAAVLIVPLSALLKRMQKSNV